MSDWLLSAGQPQEPPRLALRSTPPCQGGEFLPGADCSAAELGLGEAVKTRFYGRRCLGQEKLTGLAKHVPRECFMLMGLRLCFILELVA